MLSCTQLLMGCVRVCVYVCVRACVRACVCVCVCVCVPFCTETARVQPLTVYSKSAELEAGRMDSIHNIDIVQRPVAC